MHILSILFLLALQSNKRPLLAEVFVYNAFKCAFVVSGELNHGVLVRVFVYNRFTCVCVVVGELSHGVLSGVLVITGVFVCLCCCR